MRPVCLLDQGRFEECISVFSRILDLGWECRHNLGGGVELTFTSMQFCAKRSNGYVHIIITVSGGFLWDGI